MIETTEQFERAEEAMNKIKRFLLAARRTHTAVAYAALAAPILRELQDREREGLLYLSQTPSAAEVVASAHLEP